MAEPPIPDALFDADHCDAAGQVEREDWVVDPDGTLTYDPVVSLRWSCPDCGDSGELDDVFAVPHGAQHADGPFGVITPVTVSGLRRSEVGS